MATASFNTSVGFDGYSEVEVGSDVVIEFECKQCDRLGHKKEADHFCKDCQENVCKRCAAYHKVLPLTQNHTLVSIGEEKCVDFASTLNDKDTDWISGLTMMPNNKLVIAQKDKTFKLKIFDTSLKQIVSELKLPRAPEDVTKMSADTVAVAVPDKRKIYLARTVPKLSIAGGLNVNGESFGLSYNADKGWLAVSFITPSKVEIMDLTGQVIRTIGTGNNQVHFEKPTYVNFGADNKSLFVACSAGAIVKVGLDGRILSTYRDRDLIRPGGMATSRIGNVYVVCIGEEHTFGMNIQTISSDCKKTKCRDTRLYRDGTVEYERFYCICLGLNEQEDLVYIGTYGRGVIQAGLKNW